MSTNRNGFFSTPGELTLPHEVLHDANKQGGVAILVTRHHISLRDDFKRQGAKIM